ncbi:hypothetical protein Bbelb_159190 [Branchiostoma belcheri]|nr:hypothetical protein Bbelb_159190 [Branchiostoma belcheri]
MKHVSPFISTSALCTLYNAIFLPHITYACTAWDTAPDQDLQKIQRMQNRAGKLILKAPYRTPSIEVLTRLGWKDIKATHKHYEIMLVYKAINNKLPHYMRQMFAYCSEQSTRSTRQSTSNKLVVPKPHLESFRRSLAYRGPTAWNSLPVDIRTAPTLASFKRLLKRDCLTTSAVASGARQSPCGRSNTISQSTRLAHVRATISIHLVENVGTSLLSTLCTTGHASTNSWIPMQVRATISIHLAENGGTSLLSMQCTTEHASTNSWIPIHAYERATYGLRESNFTMLTCNCCTDSARSTCVPRTVLASSVLTPHFPVDLLNDHAEHTCTILDDLTGDCQLVSKMPRKAQKKSTRQDPKNRAAEDTRAASDDEVNRRCTHLQRASVSCRPRTYTLRVTYSLGRPPYVCRKNVADVATTKTYGQKARTASCDRRLNATSGLERLHALYVVQVGLSNNLGCRLGSQAVPLWTEQHYIPVNSSGPCESDYKHPPGGKRWNIFTLHAMYNRTRFQQLMDPNASESDYKQPPCGKRWNIFTLHAMYNRTRFNQLMDPNTRMFHLLYNQMQQVFLFSCQVWPVK